MRITTIYSKKRPNTTAGMTLVELMVAVSLSVMLSAVVLTFYLTFAKATLTISDYTDYDMETSKLLQNFSRDIREAEEINWTNRYSFKLLKKGIYYTYTYDTDLQTIERAETGGSSTTLASNITELEFQAYDVTGDPLTPGISYSTLDDSTRMLQVSGLFSKNPSARSPTSSKFASARYILRNKETAVP
jgi:type II secretory pathway pseudopilin PulG